MSLRLRSKSKHWDMALWTDEALPSRAVWRSLRVTGKMSELPEDHAGNETAPAVGVFLRVQ